MTEIPNVGMLKILQSDVLNIQVGGVADVDVTFSDAVGKVFLVRFTPVLLFYFQLGWHWGGGSGAAVVCAVVVGSGCGCGGGVSRYHFF
jgi:hypothetical protein